jgi:hypothetical protein
MLVCESALAILYNYQWSSDTTGIAVGLHFMGVLIIGNVGFRIDLPGSTLLSHCLHKDLRGRMHAHKSSVEEDIGSFCASLTSEFLDSLDLGLDEGLLD